MYGQNRASGLIWFMGITVAVLTAVFSVRTDRLSRSRAAATPESVVCDIEPRTDEEIEELAALAATPAAGTPEQIDGSQWIEGTPADPETLAALQRRLT